MLTEFFPTIFTFMVGLRKCPQAHAVFFCSQQTVDFREFFKISPCLIVLMVYPYTNSFVMKYFHLIWQNPLE